jgi:hypothetical protein
MSSRYNFLQFSKPQKFHNPLNNYIQAWNFKMPSCFSLLSLLPHCYIDLFDNLCLVATSWPPCSFSYTHFWSSSSKIVSHSKFWSWDWNSFTGLTHFNVMKVNLCLRTLWRQMVEVEVQRHSLLTSPLDGGEWSPHGLTITAEKRAPSTAWIGGREGPTFIEKIKVSFLSVNHTLDHPAIA